MSKEGLASADHYGSRKDVASRTLMSPVLSEGPSTNHNLNLAVGYEVSPMGGNGGSPASQGQQAFSVFTSAVGNIPPRQQRLQSHVTSGPFIAYVYISLF